jgi:hypothetical protein
MGGVSGGMISLVGGRKKPGRIQMKTKPEVKVVIKSLRRIS